MCAANGNFSSNERCHKLAIATDASDSILTPG